MYVSIFVLFKKLFMINNYFQQQILLFNIYQKAKIIKL
jgi:hypothetical protein